MNVLASLLAIHQATATWLTEECFPVPENCDNQCSTQQEQGFDWRDLGLGSFSSYGEFGFSGFSCSQKPSPFGKRDGSVSSSRSLTVRRQVSF